MHAFIRFYRGIFAMPTPWKIWLAVLVGANLVLPLLFVSRVEAQLVIVAFFIGMGLMTALTARFGFSRILGLGHIVWLPLLVYLMTRLSEAPAGEAFGLWLRALIALNAISVVIDTIDIVRFARGERQETVPHLVAEERS